MASVARRTLTRACCRGLASRRALRIALRYAAGILGIMLYAAAADIANAGTIGLSYQPPNVVGRTAAEITCTAFREDVHFKLPYRLTGPLLPLTDNCDLAAKPYTFDRVSTVDSEYVFLAVGSVTPTGQPNSDQQSSIVDVATRSLIATWGGLGPCAGARMGGNDGDTTVPPSVLASFHIPRCHRTRPARYLW